jgi:TonB family protein
MKLQWCLVPPALLLGALPATAYAKEPTDWIASQGSHQCSLFRVKGSKRLFSIELAASLEAPTLFLIRNTYRDARTVPVEVTLFPSGAAYAVEAGSYPAGVIVPELPADFLDNLSSSNRLTAKVGGKTSFDFTLPSVGTGVRMLRACHGRLMRSWGIDHQRYQALARKPRPIGYDTWGKGVRYPKAAARAGRRGTTVARVTVQPDGSVASCVPVASSGTAELDAEACRLLLERARFQPALGPDGAPTAVQIALTVRWLMPR